MTPTVGGFNHGSNCLGTKGWYMPKNEETVVNDAIQFWRGYTQAMESFLDNNKEKLTDNIYKYVTDDINHASDMVEEYRDRLHVLKRKKVKNARTNKK